MIAKKVTFISTIAVSALVLSACSSDSATSGDLSQDLKDQYSQSELIVTAVEEAVLVAAKAQPADFTAIVDNWDTLKADIAVYEQTLVDLIDAAREANNDTCKDALLRYQVLELVESEILGNIYVAAESGDADDLGTHVEDLETIMNGELSETLDLEIESACGLTA